jgi:hypothetical protein
MLVTTKLLPQQALSCKARSSLETLHDAAAQVDTVSASHLWSDKSDWLLPSALASAGDRRDSVRRASFSARASVSMSRWGRKARPPEGFDYLEPTLAALEAELRESESF